MCVCVCVCVCVSPDYALGKDCIMHGYMLKLGNPFLTQWQRRYFYLFPNRVEWRGEGESRVRVCVCVCVLVYLLSVYTV